MSVIGIDLGTTNCVVAVADSSGSASAIAARNGERVLPSAIFIDESGEISIGETARSMSVLEPERVAMLFKRGMGEETFLADGSDFAVNGDVWRPEELSSLLLKRLKEIAEESLGEPVEGAVVTVPAYFGELERSATRDAAEMAGIPLLRIINEPTAAAIAHGFEGGNEGENVLVFDLGGGTFDVTIMSVGADAEMTVLATGGNHKLGGTDFDSLIVQAMADHAQQEVGVDILGEAWMFADARSKAEEIKKELSTRDNSTKPLQTGTRPIMFEYDREQFESALEDIIEDVGDMIEITLDQSGLETSDIDTILMVGGSARIPVFARLLADMFNTEPEYTKNLDEDVARGAAILAAKVGGTADPESELALLTMPTDVASQGLGIRLWDQATDAPYNDVIIPAGTPLPATGEGRYESVADGQEGVRIRINEGDEADLEFCRELGEGNASFGRAVPAGYPLRVSISYNEEQIIEALAYDGETDALIGEVRIKREGSMSDSARAQAQERISRTEVN